MSPFFPIHFKIFFVYPVRRSHNLWFQYPYKRGIKTPICSIFLPFWALFQAVWRALPPYSDIFTYLTSRRFSFPFSISLLCFSQKDTQRVLSSLCASYMEDILLFEHELHQQIFYEVFEIPSYYTVFMNTISQLLAIYMKPSKFWLSSFYDFHEMDRRLLVDNEFYPQCFSMITWYAGAWSANTLYCLLG